MKGLLRGLRKKVVTSSSRLKRYLESKTQAHPKSLRVEVFVRHCYYSNASKHKNRPAYFDRELCFQNLMSTVQPGLVNVTAVLDTAFEQQDPHFILQQDDVKVVTIDEGCEAKSFLRTLDIIEEKNFHPDTIIYLLEDDYLHQSDWVNVMLEGFSLPDIDYLTLYDHPDKYTAAYEKLSSKLYRTKSCHWRTTPSTTNTYAMRWSTLRSHLSIHRQYSKDVKISKDHAKFCELKKLGATLISCIPGYSSHIESNNESPCIDWEKQLSNTKQKLGL